MGKISLATNARPVWFGVPDRPLFGWWHAPADARAGGAAVLCPPVGRDHAKAYFTYRVLAERLADRGVAVLRFDYHGTGDSAGLGSDIERHDAWLASTASAIHFARSSGAESLTLIGMTIGATIAAHAAAVDGGIERLVLWDPAASGRSFLRQQTAITSLKFGIPGRREDGSVETPGFVYPACGVAEFHELNLERLDHAVARNVLVLSRPNRNGHRNLTDRLGKEAVDYRPCPEQPRLMDVEPPYEDVPYRDIETVTEWVSQEHEEPSAPVQVPEGRDHAVVGQDAAGRPITERAVSLPSAGLFGMFTEVGPERSDRPLAVFLNSSDEHHMGPNRLWVELARRWASSGIDGLRVDLSGLGDSPVRHDAQPWLQCCAPEAFDDMIDIFREASQDGRRPLILVGLCSSAYQAIESALSLRPAGVVLLNPGFSFVPPEQESGRPTDPRRRIVLNSDRATKDPRKAFTLEGSESALEKLKRRIRNQRRTYRVMQALMELDFHLRARLAFLLHRMSRPRTWCRLLVQNSTDVLLVTGEGDNAMIRADLSDRVIAELAETGRFRYAYVPGLDHGIVLDSQRRAVVDLVTDHVLSCFAPAKEPDSEPRRRPVDKKTSEVGPVQAFRHAETGAADATA
jgi:alpha-beta hydrolase superfamily lysophospholipase